MKELYKKLPLFIQHCVITLVNNYKYFQKFGAFPFFYPLSKVIRNIDVKSYNSGKSLEHLNGLIEYAVKHVPYYRDRKNDYPTLHSLDELDKLPILYKDTFKKNNHEFLSDEITRFNSYKFRTSGSTGTPLKGAIKNIDLKERLHTFLISLKKEGIDYSKRVARFPGADVARNSKVYRRDFINNHFLFSIYHLSNDRILDYYHGLNDHKIEILEGYPSTIISLMRLLKANKLKLPYVKNILTTAEKLLPHDREELELFFNAKIFDFYGSSEGSVYMYADKNGVYHNSDRVGYLECVNDNYQNVPIGVSGRMIVTSFLSKFTPLIRYDIGDYATISSNDNGIIEVAEVLGRQEDIFITPSGKSFGRFSLFLKYLPEGLLESQLILTQRSNKAELMYISICNIQLEEFKEFEKMLEKYLDVKFKIEYRRIEKFDKAQRGKLRAVVIKK